MAKLQGPSQPIGRDTQGNYVFPTELSKGYKDPSTYLPPRWDGGKLPTGSGGGSTPSTPSPTSTGLSQAEINRISQEIEKQRTSDLFKANQQYQQGLRTARSLDQRRQLLNSLQDQISNIQANAKLQRVERGIATSTTFSSGGYQDTTGKYIPKQDVKVGFGNTKSFREQYGLGGESKQEQITTINEVSQIPKTYKQLVREYGVVTGSTKYLGQKGEEVYEKTGGLVGVNLPTIPFTKKTPLQMQIEKKLTGAVAETAPYFSPYGIGAGLLVIGGTERLTTKGGKEELNQIGDFLESKGLPSNLKYAVPAGEIALGVLGIKQELKTLSNLRKIANEVPIGEASTKTISVTRKQATNFLLNNADDDLRTLIQKQRVSGTRIYETSIPVKAGQKKIVWVELSSSKGSQGINQGKRVLYGIEFDAKGNVISNLGGLAIEKIDEKGTSNLITNIIRETKGQKKLYITPAEEKELLTFAEQIKSKGSKRIGNIQLTSSESRAELISRRNLLSLPSGEKSKLTYEGLNIPKPFSGTKSISKEVTLYKKPLLKITKGGSGKIQTTTSKLEQRGLGFGTQQEVSKSSFKILKKSKPFSEAIDESVGMGGRLTKQTTKQIVKQELGRASSFAQAFAKTISKPITETRKGVSSLVGKIGGLGRVITPETKVSNLTKEKITNTQKELNNVKLKLPVASSEIEKESLLNRQKVLNQQLSNLNSQLKEEQKTFQTQLNRQQQLQRQRQQLQNPPQRTSFNRTPSGDYTKPRIKIPILSLSSPFSSRRRTFQRQITRPANIGYNVYARERGKFRKLNRLPLPYKQSLKLGAFSVDNTTSARFKIKPVMNPKKLGKIRVPYSNLSNFRDYRISKGKRIKLNNEYIELKNKRINTIGEKQGLRIAKLLKTKRFKGFFKK